MSFNLGAIGSALTLDTSDYDRKLEQAPETAERSLKKIAELAATYLTLRSLVQFGTNAAKAFTVQQDAVEGVRSALRNAGAEIDANTESLKAFASSLQGITKYGDEGTLAAMAQGLNLKVQVQDLQAATKAAMVLAQKYTGDLNTAMMLVGRASQGQTSMLTRYGIVLDETMTAEEKYHAILKMGEDEFGLVTDAAKTASGQVTQFGNNFGDSMEIIGESVMTGALPVVGVLNDIVLGFNNADPATQKLIITTASLAAGLALLQTGFMKAINAKIAYTLQTRLAAAADVQAAGAMTMGTRAAMLLTGSFRAASLAVKSFFVSLGPIGWAMIAIASVTAVMNSMSAAAERAAAKAQKLANDTSAALDKMTQSQTKALAQLKRLEMLANYEKLNNSEMKEADRLIKALGLSEDAYTKRIDENTGKLILKKKTMQELREEMVKTMTEQRKAELEKDIKAQQQVLEEEYKRNGKRGFFTDPEAVKNARSHFTKPELKALDDLESGKPSQLGWEVNEKYMKFLNEELNKIEAITKATKKLADSQAALDAINNGVTIEMNDDEVAEANEKVRKLRESLEEREWQIKFDAAEPEEQLDMIAEKIDEINARILQARGNEEEVLKLQRELLDLEEQRAKTRQKIADETKRNAEAIENERRQAEKIEEDRNQRRAEKELDRKLDRMMQQGDRSGALKIMENQLEQARQAAEIMKRQYEQAYRDATADGKITEEEQKQLDERRRKYEEAMAQEEKWSDRLEDEKSRDTRRNEAVGGFSAQMLNLQLGSGSAEERTARATEKNAAELEALRRWLRMNMPKRTDGEIEEQGETYDA